MSSAVPFTLLAVATVGGAGDAADLAARVGAARHRVVTGATAWTEALHAAVEDGFVLCLDATAAVSPGVAAYLDAAHGRYGQDERIAAFALGAWRYRGDGVTPFIPLEDGGDAIFHQAPPTADFAVTAAQARRWLDGASAGWTLRPRASLAIGGDQNLSRQLDPAARDWRLRPFDEALAVYDRRWEITPAVLKRLHPALASYDFDVDLDGLGGEGSAPYLLSSRPCHEPVMGFALEMTPWEASIAFDVVGDMFSLAPRDRFAPMTQERRTRLLQHLTRHTYVGGYLKQFLPKR